MSLCLTDEIVSDSHDEFTELLDSLFLLPKLVVFLFFLLKNSQISLTLLTPLLQRQGQSAVTVNVTCSMTLVDHQFAVCLMYNCCGILGHLTIQERGRRLRDTDGLR